MCSSTSNLKTLPAAVSSSGSDTFLPQVKKQLWKASSPSVRLGAAEEAPLPITLREAMGTTLGLPMGISPWVGVSPLWGVRSCF